MKKLKDFGSFVTENNSNENKEVVTENILTDLSWNIEGLDTAMKAAYYVGLSIGAITATGFVGVVGYAAGDGILTALQNSKLGERGKEFANKIKSLGLKGASLFKSKQTDENFPSEVNDTLTEYQDVVGDLNDGVLGEEGKKFAETIEKADTSEK